MPPRRKGRRKVDAARAERKRKLKALIEEFEDKVEITRKTLESECKDLCAKIEDTYDLELMNIPEIYHELTVKQYLDALNKTPPSSKNMLASLSAYHTKFKSLTEKKAMSSAVRRIKNKTEKRSFISHPYQRTTGFSTAGAKGTNSHQKLFRTALASLHSNTPLQQKRTPFLITPTVKSSTSKPVITPKFDPRVPLRHTVLRKPRANEIIVSLSGSPLQNPVTSEPSLILSYKGQVVDLSETSQLNKLDLEKMDKQTKENLKMAQEKLSKMIW